MRNGVHCECMSTRVKLLTKKSTKRQSEVKSNELGSQIK